MIDNSRVRVSLVGVVVIALFAALLSRMWFLQVAQGATIVPAIEQRIERFITEPTPRGRILDRTGKVLVDNRVTWVLRVSRKLEGKRRTEVVGRLAELLGMTVAAVDKRIADPRRSPFEDAIVTTDVSAAVRLAIAERREEFPGVTVEEAAIREYPYGVLAAQVLGYVGRVTAEDLKRHPKYGPNDDIGRAGIEAAYEADLRGVPSRERVEVDPAGKIVGDTVQLDAGRVGHDVQLTIDAGVQQVAEQALDQGIQMARSQQNTDVKNAFARYRAPAGCVVVLDARDGSVVAMASNPSFMPSEFIGGISQQRYEQLTKDPNGHQPLINRATQGLYAPGSTFKLVTSIAMLEDGLRTRYTTIQDKGQVKIADRIYRNAAGVANGRVDLQKALTVSSDVYYYELGYQYWKAWKSGDPAKVTGLERVAREFGFGEKTGFELDEVAGRVPTPEWKKAFAQSLYSQPQQQREFGAWNPGDDVGLAVGQGDLVVTPLQLANAYATFANGGTLFAPHVAARTLDDKQRTVRTIAPVVRRQTSLRTADRDAILAGFLGVPRTGTASEAFSGFPLSQISVAGKTGTAQVGVTPGQKGDTSLFAAMFPANAAAGSPQYVVLAVVEEAGRGGRIAAPIVRRVVEGINGLPLTAIPDLGRTKD